MTEILDKIISSNIIVFASPVYFYSFNAQMKAIMDRTYAKLESIKDKEAYLIISGARTHQKLYEYNCRNLLKNTLIVLKTLS